MNNDEIKKILESSFSPYRCFVQPNKQSYGSVVGMQITNDKNLILITVQDIKISTLNSEERLMDFITQIKIEIRNKKFPIL